MTCRCLLNQTPFYLVIYCGLRCDNVHMQNPQSKQAENLARDEYHLMAVHDRHTHTDTGLKKAALRINSPHVAV